VVASLKCIIMEVGVSEQNTSTVHVVLYFRLVALTFLAFAALFERSRGCLRADDNG